MSARRATLLEVLLRSLLGLGAFILLWRFPEPLLIEIPSSDVSTGFAEGPSLASLILQVVVGTVAGAVFALAARPIWGSWSYRWELTAALAVIPVLILTRQVLVFSGTVPFTGDGLLGSASSFVISNFSLRVAAILLGVALAQGVVEREEPIGEDDG